jgi:hypothetical protein
MQRHPLLHNRCRRNAPGHYPIVIPLSDPEEEPKYVKRNTTKGRLINGDFFPIRVKL